MNGQKCSKASTGRVSVLEESTAAVNRPMIGVFNNLVIFKQRAAKHVALYRPGAGHRLGLE